jgi:cytochrome P450
VFDPSRDDLSKHYAFGEGMRFCLGAHLARLEADIMLTELLDRTENLTVQESTLKPYISPEIYGPKELSLSVST